MESILPGEAGPSAQTARPHLPYREIEQELLEFFTPELLHDLLSEIPGMSLFAVKGALLFIGKNADMYIMHSRERGPFFVDSETVRTAFSMVASDSGMLPPGTIRFGTGLSGERWMAVYIPPARYTLNLVNLEPTLVRVNVPLPGFVFAGVASNFFLWAVKEPVMREETVVYKTPLPNVFAGGGICWGAVPVPKVGNTTIFPAFRLFMESLFNGNLVAEISHKYPKDARLLLLELAQSKQRVYPFEDLVPMLHGGQVCTLQDALREHVIPKDVR